MASFAACNLCDYSSKWKDMGKLTGMTSFPIPSAGMRPILSVCLAAIEKGLKGTLNMAGGRL